jgi:hypothetical protein
MPLLIPSSAFYLTIYAFFQSSENVVFRDAKNQRYKARDHGSGRQLRRPAKIWDYTCPSRSIRFGREGDIVMTCRRFRCSFDRAYRQARRGDRFGDRRQSSINIRFAAGRKIITAFKH